MKIARVLRSPFEIGAFMMARALIPWLPRAAVVRLAALLGAVAYGLDVRSRRVARANLRAVFPEAFDENALREAFRVFVLTFLDLFWFSRHSAERLRRYVALAPSFDGYMHQTPVIAVCAHYGNWEVMGQAAALAGAPSVSVATPLRNPVIDRLVYGLRTRTGQHIIPRAGAVRGLLRTLRNGGRAALLLDQNTRLSEGGDWVPFFGLPVPVSGIVELLARRTGSPAIAVYAHLQADGSYLCEAGPLLHAADYPESGSLTAALMRDLESRIRQKPGQWLWMYKRWKYIHPEFAAERYPFYAHPAAPELKSGGNRNG